MTSGNENILPLLINPLWRKTKNKPLFKAQAEATTDVLKASLFKHAKARAEISNFHQNNP